MKTNNMVTSRQLNSEAANSTMTKKEVDHVAYTLEKLIEWARKATETEGLMFHGLHPVESAETVLKFLKIKASGEL